MRKRDSWADPRTHPKHAWNQYASQRPPESPKACIWITFNDLWQPPGFSSNDLGNNSIIVSCIPPNRQAPNIMQNNCKIPLDNWQRTFGKQLITNAHLETVQAVWKFPRRYQGNKPQIRDPPGRACRPPRLSTYLPFLINFIFSAFLSLLIFSLSSEPPTPQGRRLPPALPPSETFWDSGLLGSYFEIWPKLQNRSKK